jgi:heptosyltransferase-2
MGLGADFPEPGKILIRATNWIGDAVMSLPALQAVRTRFPKAAITVLARPWVADLYARESVIDRVILYDAPSGARGLAQKWAIAKALRRQRFDLAILLQNAFEGAALVRLAGIPKRIGYNRDGRGWLLTKAVPVPSPGTIPAHQRFYYLELLKRAGVLETIPVCDQIRLEGLRDAAVEGSAHFGRLGLRAPFIGVSPGAAYGTAKRWLPERFAETATRVAAQLGATVALFGSNAEQALCEEVAALIQAPVHNFAGATSLRQFIEMTAACKLFLTNDSGAMHIASALGIPTVTVFGATDDQATGPTGPLARVVRHPVECSPCLLRECPIDHRCMTGVTSAEVSIAGLELIATASTP